MLLVAFWSLLRFISKSDEIATFGTLCTFKGSIPNRLAKHIPREYINKQANRGIPPKRISKKC
ncbi:hypothetical protein CGI43_20350 [Vibrio parahaemolyticus]|nr:hypothetical protein CGI43_20350 [Vibrio parahaemolyticus]